MDVDKNIKSNIWKYYLATSLGSFGFYIPIIQLFYLASGLTVFKIAILGVIWTIVKMVLEVPSSILADKWGRKKFLIISSIFTILQLVTLIYSREYFFFVLASIFSAAAFAFLSGTGIAFFYDTLKALKKEESFDKLWAKQQVYSQIPFIIAFVTSGFLFKISPVFPFQLSLFFLIISTIVMFSLVEPARYKQIEEMKFLTNFKESVKIIFKNSYLRFALIFTILFSLGSDISYGYGQIYLKQVSLPVVLFGIVFMIKSLFVTIAANLTPILRRKFSYQGLFGFQIIAITILFYVMVLTNNYIVGAICFILIAIPHGLFGIAKSSYMHKHIESHQRATIDSMFSFFIAALFLIIEPIFGYLADTYSIKIPFLLIAMTMTGYCFYYVIYGHKRV